MSPQSLGPYRILDRLGAGAMGEVYRAEDTRLGRSVALKVLASEVSGDPRRVRRFEQEAKLVASLNHPNIVTLHSFESEGDIRFLTMELVEGRRLDQCIPDAGMELESFFEIAIPLVEAVAAAHGRGITHRDLKPSNIMVNEDGRVKVLDFGLAKLRESNKDLGELLTVVDSEAGQLIGTVAYMAPEQAEGKAADARSDIFALGIVLYEMAQGRRPFTGGSAASIMSSILRDTPAPVRQSRRELPRQLDRILGMCLAKEPGRRFQSALDLRNALTALRDELREGPSEEVTGDGTAVVDGTQSSPWLVAGAIGLAGLVLGALGAAWLGSTDPGGGSEPVAASAAAVTLAPISRDGNLSDFPTWSPDGSQLVYASDATGNMDLWRVPAGGGEPELMGRTPFDEREATWSPRGGLIAYVASPEGEPAIYLISDDGRGRPRKLAGPAATPAWSPDGSRLAYAWAGSVYLVRAEVGAEPSELLSGTAGSPHPVWSHDGRAIYVWNWVEADVQRVPVDNAAPENLGLVPTREEVVSLAVAPDGSELIMARGQYGAHKDLWGVELDPSTGLPIGDPYRLTGPFTDDRHAAYGPDGRVAFAARSVERHLTVFDLDPQVGPIDGTQGRQVTWSAPQNYYPSLSPDGTRAVWTAHPGAEGFLYTGDLVSGYSEKVTGFWERGSREVSGSFSSDGEQLVYASPRDGTYEIWHVPCVQCAPLQLTRNQAPARDSMPAWGPGDRFVAFSSTRSGNWDIWLASLEPGTEPQPLTSLPGNELYPNWSPDGARVAFAAQRGDRTDIWEADVASGAVEPLVEAPGQEAWGAWSPDGSTFYFSSDRSGSFEIWKLTPGGELTQVTRFDSITRGLPEAGLYTKFDVSDRLLLLPIEERKGEVWMLERAPVKGASN